MLKQSMFLVFLSMCYMLIGQGEIIPIEPTFPLNSEVSTQSISFDLDVNNVRSKLRQAPLYRSDMNEAWIPMEFILPSGERIMLEVSEDPVAEKPLYEKYPENKTYRMKGKNWTGRMSVSPGGVTAILFGDEGSFFIEPVRRNESLHRSYHFSGQEMKNFNCMSDHIDAPSNRKKINTRNVSNGTMTRNYRIALATTGEFFMARGNNNTAVNADIQAKLVALNALYEKEFSITFTLIASNDDLLYSDPSTDPFTTSGSTASASQAGNFFNNNVNPNIYDIGHVLHDYSVPSGYSASGQAGLGVVCNISSKGRGWTGAGGQYPVDFFLGTFGHEIGHQFNAKHTFYGTTGNCAGSQRSIGTGYEPGSGNSIMSYEGSCGPAGGCPGQNITPYAQTIYFHTFSAQQIIDYASGSGTCATTTSSGNAIPVLSMPGNQTIPKGTPFTLSASATDGNNSTLFYSWEQYDTDNLSLSCPDGEPNDAATSTTAPLFRSFDPSTNGHVRHFPQLSDIINNTQTMGEILPQVSRDMNFRCTVRDFNTGGGAMISDGVTITVDGNSGPFEITNLSSGTSFNPGATTTLTWDVANTNQSPVNCTSVKILFSADGGFTFPYTLTTNTANDGSASITFPSITTNEGRIKLEAVGNIFFDMNNTDIILTNNCTVEGGTIINASSVMADAGDPALNLDLNVGINLSGYTGSLGTGSTNLAVRSTQTSTSCTTYGNTGQYEIINIVPTQSGTYTISLNAPFIEIINLYSSFNPASPCSNFLRLNAYFNGSNISISNSMTFAGYVANTTYELVISGGYFGDTPGSYQISSISGPGELYTTTNFPFLSNNYTYIIVDENSGNILAFSANSDLSDDQVFMSGNYKVYGLAYTGTLNSNSYEGTSFSSFQSLLNAGSICGDLTTNHVSVTINGCTPGNHTVMSSSDNNTIGTLRYFLENSCPGDLINFDNTLMGQTITFSTPINVERDVDIIGLGKSNLTFSGNNLTSLFSIQPGANVTFQNVTMANGHESTDGGAFLNQGTVILKDVLLLNNMEGSFSKAFTNNGEVRIESGTVEIK